MRTAALARTGLWSETVALSRDCLLFWAMTRRGTGVVPVPIRDKAGFRSRQPACVHRPGGGNATGWPGSLRRRDVAGRAPAHREYPRNETRCRRSGRHRLPAGRPLAPVGIAVRSLARWPFRADTARQAARRAIGGRDHNADAQMAWSRVHTSPELPPPPGYRRTRAEIPGM